MVTNIIGFILFEICRWIVIIGLSYLLFCIFKIIVKKLNSRNIEKLNKKSRVEYIIVEAENLVIYALLFATVHTMIADFFLEVETWYITPIFGGLVGVIYYSIRNIWRRK